MAAEDVRQRQLALMVSQRQLTQAKADHALLIAGAWKPDKDIARARSSRRALRSSKRKPRSSAPW